MRDWPIPRMSCNSATESSSCSSRSSSRKRVGSASNRRKLIVDAIERLYHISTYHDWSICCLRDGYIVTKVTLLQKPARPSAPFVRFNVVTLVTLLTFSPCHVVTFFPPNQ